MVSRGLDTDIFEKYQIGSILIFLKNISLGRGERGVAAPVSRFFSFTPWANANGDQVPPPCPTDYLKSSAEITWPLK